MESSRRKFLSAALGGTVSVAWAAGAGPTPSERAAMDGVANAFMAAHKVPGMSVAFARHGELVYENAFGFADREKGDKTTPAHLFRIASVTKPLTSAAIFQLVEQKRMGLDDLVFGPHGVVAADFGAPPS